MIPQDVTGYKFTLFGPLTIRQFLEILIPCVVAVGVWMLGPPMILRIPICVVLVAFGFISALVPINDRPLWHWVIVFFQQLYAPTKFYWRRRPQIPAYLESSTTATAIVNKNTPAQNDDLFATAVNNQKQFSPAEYWQTMDYTEEDPLEAGQQEYINALLDEFDHIQVQQVEARPQFQKPNVATDQAQRQRPILGST